MDLSFTRILVLLLVLLPFVSAGVVLLFGRSARRAALLLAILHLALTANVVIRATVVLPGSLHRVGADYKAIYPGERTGRQMAHFIQAYKFSPEFVPGDTAGENGSDHQTSWTLLNLSSTNSNEPGPKIQFFLGIDGLNIWLVALSSLMLLPAILVSWESISERRGLFYFWLFVLQGATIGAFLSFDVILFYVFFELTLIPAFFLIGHWGVGSGRRDAARKFFLYTLAGGLLTLVGVLGVVLTNPSDNGQITFSLPELMLNVQYGLERAAVSPQLLNEKLNLQFWFFIALMAGFMVKVPLVPFHTWLPASYGEAPIGVTVLLASLLSKLGTFGILRFVLPLVPDAALKYGLPAVGTLAAFGIIYGALCAYAQREIKMMIAYSSISHLGFLVLGIFAFDAEGLSGAALHMVNHGITIGALFALLAFLLDRYRTTEIRQFGGLIGRYPVFAFLSFVLCLASIGLPGLNNFVSEMLMLAGLYDARNPSIHRLGLAVVAAFGILLSSWYILTMLQRVYFNPLKEPPVTGPLPATDVNSRELLTFGSLAVLCLVLGLFPQVLLSRMKADVDVLVGIGDAARARAK